MQAVQMTASGGPEVLRPVEMPEPRIERPTQIKVRIEAAGINPIDTKLRQRGVFFPDALPAVLGCDASGTVVDRGDGASRFRDGDAVWFCHGGLGREQGNYAEFTVLEADLARPKPASLDFATAAAGPLVLITAWEALFDRAGLTRGQTVLVQAGAGGVGHVAVQLAKLAGARVCATVGSAEHADFVRTLGADEVINYRETDFVEAVLQWTGGRGVDVVFDTVGGETFQRSLSAAAHYGAVVTLLDPGTGVAWKAARDRNLRIGFELMLTPMLHDLPDARTHQGEILDSCREYIDAGRLRLHVEQTFPLAEAARAHEAIERGHTTGKLVLLP